MSTDNRWSERLERNTPAQAAVSVPPPASLEEFADLARYAREQGAPPSAFFDSRAWEFRWPLTDTTDIHGGAK